MRTCYFAASPVGRPMDGRFLSSTALISRSCFNPLAHLKVRLHADSTAAGSASPIVWLSARPKRPAQAPRECSLRSRVRDVCDSVGTSACSFAFSRLTSCLLFLIPPTPRNVHDKRPTHSWQSRQNRTSLRIFTSTVCLPWRRLMLDLLHGCPLPRATGSNTCPTFLNDYLIEGTSC